MSVRLYSQPHTYEIQEILGESLFSIVYLAVRFDHKLQVKQSVVIKVFKQRKSPLAKLQLQSLLYARQCSHLVKVLAFEYFQNWPALVLEHIPGLNLKQLLQKTQITAEEKQYICSEILLGLKELEQARLCHGDLSLDNILIDTRGSILLTDYGLANYADKDVYSTQPFNAPELSQTVKPNFQSDLFSLGVLEKILMNKIDKNSLTAMRNEHFICPEDPLLDVNPQNRKYKSFNYSSDTKILLSKKVRRVLALGSLNQTVRSLPFFLQKKLSFILPTKWLLCSLILILLISSEIPLFSNKWQNNTNINDIKTSASAKLFVRTRKWVHIQIAGHKGYAPITIIQKPGVYKMKWKTQTASGEKHIILHPGQSMILTDQDFTKFHGAFYK